MNSILRALEHFKKTTTHMAFVVDEFGNLEGVVTPIDLAQYPALRSYHGRLRERPSCARAYRRRRDRCRKEWTAGAP